MDNANHDWWGGLGEMTSSHVFEIVGQDGSEGHKSIKLLLFIEVYSSSRWHSVSFRATSHTSQEPLP